MHVGLAREAAEERREPLLHLRGVQREQLLELVHHKERLAVAPPPAAHQIEKTAVSSTDHSRWSASTSPASSGTSACPRPRKGAAPGVDTSAPPGGRDATTPARTNDVLPAPEGPITPDRCRDRSLSQSDATSVSRPKNQAASFSVKLRSPGYGLFSSTSCSTAAPGAAPATASSATTSS